MQSFNIVKSTPTEESFRINKLIGMFDIHTEHLTQIFSGAIEIPESWNIGAIVGRSGTGKSTIAKELFGLFQTSYSNKAIIDEMPENKTVEEITKTFTQVGFSSPPSWLKSYTVLSNGEKMRVDLAKALLSDMNPIVFDEFTSVVDRDVAKICSMVINKNIRQNNRRFIAVSCHYDILDWLEPDWIFSTDEMKMINVKKNDLTSNYHYIKDRQITGDCLSHIII